VACLTDRRNPLSSAVWGVVYAVFLTIAPFEHHDIACHFKTPLHCTSCSSSVVSSSPSSPAGLAASVLADAGSASADQPLAEDILLPVRSTGRSPPSPA
jgi:hypothetical protein